MELIKDAYFNSRSHQTMRSFCLEKNMKMIYTSYGYMSTVEAKIIGDIDREEKKKKTKPNR